MVKSVHKSIGQLWKNSRLTGKLGRIFKVALLILKDRKVYWSIRTLVRYLSCVDELPADHFYVNIVRWGEDLSKWQRGSLERKRKETVTFEYRPTITVIIPIFGSGGGYVKETLESVYRQHYEDWELYIVVDTRPKFQVSKLTTEIFGAKGEIKIKYVSDLEQNLDGALNEVLNECNGDFIGFLSGSDQLTRNALFEIINLLNQYPDADIIYSDEAEKDNKTLIHLLYKPRWSQDLFLSMNYLRNFLCCRAEVIRTVGGFHGNFEDDIKYDLILRIIEKTERIHHIPNILYYEQVPKSSYPKEFTADYSFELHKKALRNHIKRDGIEGEVCDGIFKGSFRVRRRILSHPKVSIIIPTKDKSDQLKRCIESIGSKTTYRNFEIIIVDNASTEPELVQYLDASPHKIIQYAEKFNFSKVNNLAAQHATGEYLLFLNNDTEVISREWLEAMLEHAQREEVGIVGAKLLYPNGPISHAGMVIERDRVRQINKYTNLYEHGYCGMADVVRNFDVVSGACLMIRKNVFKEVGGFRENLATIYNDVDLCLKVRSRGYLVIYTPYAVLYHYEGISKWSDLEKEVDSVHSFYSGWNECIQNDSYFNPNCSSNIKSLFRINR